jgi:hypothetical protein
LLCLVFSILATGFIFGFVKDGVISGVLAAILSLLFVGFMPLNEGGVGTFNAWPIALVICFVCFLASSYRAYKRNQSEADRNNG